VSAPAPPPRGRCAEWALSSACRRSSVSRVPLLNGLPLFMPGQQRLLPATDRYFKMRPVGHSSSRPGVYAKTHDRRGHEVVTPSAASAPSFCVGIGPRAGATAIEAGPACRVFRWATMVKNQDLDTRPIGFFLGRTSDRPRNVVTEVGTFMHEAYRRTEQGEC
jgi:hypothetical protein